MKPTKGKTKTPSNKYSQATITKTMDDSNGFALLSLYKDDHLAVIEAIKYLHRYFRKSHAMGLYFMSHFGREHILMEWHNIVYKVLVNLGSLYIDCLPPDKAAKAQIYRMNIITLRKVAVEYEKWFSAEADQLHQIVGTRQKQEKRTML